MQVYSILFFPLVALAHDSPDHQPWSNETVVLSTFMNPHLDPLLSTSDPCSNPAWTNLPVCKAKRKNNGCGGSGCWSCDWPLGHTDCILSSWIGWKGDKQKFANACDGQLVRWGQDSGVQDCGRPCVGCSWIRACCDHCNTIFQVSGQWQRIACRDTATEVSFSYGVDMTNSGSWSLSATWSAAVTAESSASAEVEGIGGSRTLSGTSSFALTESVQSAWSVSSSSSTTLQFTQPAKTCAWNWLTTITDSCGTRTATSNDFIITRGASRGNAPCCLPGLIMDKDGNCPPDTAGNVINLCKNTVTDNQAVLNEMHALGEKMDKVQKVLKRLKASVNEMEAPQHESSQE